MKKEYLSILNKIMQEGFSKANFQIIDQYVSENFIEHQFGAKGGRDGIKNTILQIHSGLSDLQFVLQKSVEDGDTVWAHFRVTSVHSGTFMNMPPSGKQITIDIMEICRFEDGMLVEHWGVPDRFAAMVQLGAYSRRETVA